MMNRLCAVALLVLAAMVEPSAASAQEATPLEREVLHLTNEARTRPAAYVDRLQRRGDTPKVREAVRALQATAPMAPLAWSPGLARAAADHVQDLGPRGARGHEGRDGSDPRMRMDRHGTTSGYSGENISYGVPDAEGVVNQLLMSAGHRENILNPSYRFIGVAEGHHDEYRTMVVQTFAEGYEEESALLAAERARQARVDALRSQFGAEAVVVYDGVQDGSRRYRYEHDAADLVMYGATWCGACSGKARQLREQNVPHVILYINRSEAAREEYVALLQEAGYDNVFVPSFRFGEQFMAGNPSVDRLLDGVASARRERERSRQPFEREHVPPRTSLLPGYRPGDASQWAEVTMGLRAAPADVGAGMAEVGRPVVTLQATTPLISRRLRLGLGVALTEQDWSYAFGTIAYSLEAVQSRFSLVALPGLRYGAELATEGDRLSVSAWRMQPYGRLGLRLFHLTLGVEAALHDPAASEADQRVHLGLFVQWGRR